ncbi:hypothetical protein FCM35_KLT13347 [Carex littledalei]|uniref:F-box protein n=1 Tax=Carex littledalei TaxID=544730 RepID=A0A833QM47_9POAL|nr:hypothetical protein FCM35_KLT13347 [Carex littledalei]
MIPDKKSSPVKWAELNPDLLHIISKKLCDISSFICFRAVCKRWRSATSLSDPPVQFPWVIDWPRGKGTLNFTFRFYSINTHKTHTFEVPDAHIYGPSDGRVLIYEGYRCSKECRSFLNPLSWEEQFLPFVVPVQNVKPIRLWRNLTKNDEPAVVYNQGAHHILCSWHPEKNKWTKKRFPLARTVAFYDHKFFVAELSSRRITVIDEESQFEVYRLENYPQNPHWTKLSGIGDLMLFLKASDFGGFRGNCIYFITTRNKPKRSTEHVIGRFDIGLNKTEKISAPAWLGNRTWERQATWFLPTLN